MYVEMLHSLLRLRLNPVDGSANSAAPVDPTSTIPLTYAANYDTAVKWAVNPREEYGTGPQRKCILDNVSVKLKRRLCT